MSGTRTDEAAHPVERLLDAPGRAGLPTLRQHVSSVHMMSGTTDEYLASTGLIEPTNYIYKGTLTAPSRPNHSDHLVSLSSEAYLV